MVTFGLDISHHQGTSLDLAQCRREGVEFVFLKATEGSSFVDSAFAANLKKARAAGLLVAAYHYVRSDATAAGQVANVRRAVPLDVPVIPDVEANSGGVALLRDFVARLQAAGYHVPLTYLPRWYWQQIGSPSLAGLPSLWSSRYPDNLVDSLANEYADVPASYWNGYGGLGVTVLQFTSSARVAGHQPLDGNAYIGTREQLAAVLGSEEDDMTPEQERRLNFLYEAALEGGPSTPGGSSWQELWRATNANTVSLLEAFAAQSSNEDLTPERMAQIVKDATPTAEQTAAALLPLVESVTERVIAADNSDLAAEFLRQLRAALPATTPEGNNT